MIVDRHGRAIPFGARVLEIADHFTLLAIDADHRKALALEARPQRGDMLELLIPVRTGVGGDLLAVDAQREIHLVQEASDSIGRNRNVDLPQHLGDQFRRLASPLQSCDRVSGRIVL